jgi:hypothetical protein
MSCRTLQPALETAMSSKAYHHLTITISAFGIILAIAFLAGLLSGKFL